MILQKFNDQRGIIKTGSKIAFVFIQQNETYKEKRNRGIFRIKLYSYTSKVLWVYNNIIIIHSIAIPNRNQELILSLHIGLS